MISIYEKIDELDTPALILDLDVLENNIKRMSNICKKSNVKLRPHIKTHKMPIIAHLSIDAGAVGIAVSKLGEAEVMEASGIKDIMVANQIIGERKIKRLINLSRRIKISSLVDSIEGARMLSEIAAKEGINLTVYLEINIGMNRCGVKSGESAVEMAKSISLLPNLNLVGVLGFRSVWYKQLQKYDQNIIWKLGIEEGKILVENAEKIRKAGVQITEVVAGSTPTSAAASTVPGVTEVQPGTHVFNDIMTVSVGGCEVKDCAASVIVTVTSKPTARRAIIDAGTKTLVGDYGSECFPSIVEGHGLIKNKTDVILKNYSEEHGELLLDSNCDINIGDRLEIIPNHICPVVNTFDEIIGVRNGRIEVVWPILARGKVK